MKIKEVNNFSDFGFISFSRLKTFKVFDTKIVLEMIEKRQGQVLVRQPLKWEEPPSEGYSLFYTCAPEQIWHSQLELCETLV